MTIVILAISFLYNRAVGKAVTFEPLGLEPSRMARFVHLPTVILGRSSTSIYVGIKDF